MTPTTTRSTRIKKPVINNVIGETNKPKQAYVKKKKQLRAKKDNSNTVLEPETHPMNTIDSTHSTIDPSEHPDYIRLMSELEDSKQKRLEKIKMLRDHEHRLILDWFASQKKQLLNEYYFARKKARTSLAEEVQSKLVKIRQESNQLNKQSKTQYSDCDYSDWVPPERLHTIGSFVDGATSEEIDRDITIAKQPYNGSNTPNLIYSDYESRSTTNTPTEESDAPLARDSQHTIQNDNQSSYHLYSHQTHFNDRSSEAQDWWPSHPTS